MSVPKSPISGFPRLDPKQVLRIYKKLNIDSVDALRERLRNGDIKKQFGSRMAAHIRQGLAETHAMLLYRADDLREMVEKFLVEKCRVKKVEVAGDYRRRAEVIEELSFLVETDDFPALLAKLERYGGRTPAVASSKDNAVFALSSGILLRIQVAGKKDWGLALVECTGSKTHVRKLIAVTGSLKLLKTQGSFPTEEALYKKFGLAYIEPELRKGHDEVERAEQAKLPVLATVDDIRG